jgi:hypothetical protein
MEPEGIRKVIAKQGLEGAVLYLDELIREMAVAIENNKPLPPIEEPKVEEKVGY